MEEEVGKIDNEVVDDLTSFFDLLARFDFEDNQSASLSINNSSEPTL